MILISFPISHSYNYVLYYFNSIISCIWPVQYASDQRVEGKLSSVDWLNLIG